MGASYDEVAVDYMTTFYNYYGITPDDERYNNILTSNIEKSLQRVFGVTDLRSRDLSAKAAEYLKSTGISDEEIAQLKQNLSGVEASSPAPAAEETGPAAENTAPTATDTAPAATDIAPAAEVIPQTQVPENIYEVKAGDSLSKIAKEKYGDSNKWTEIYNLNKDIISNSGIIYRGQELKLAE
jgi:nucleoid-associated protein YgaU